MISKSMLSLFEQIGIITGGGYWYSWPTYPVQKNPYFILHEEFLLFPKLGCSSEQANENNGAGFAQISFKGEACVHCNVDQEGV